MDALAERAGLGKGTVFRRFGTRAGIFAALLDDDERAFQPQVLAGPPPLGPGAAPLDRLIAYGRARTRFLIDHCDIATRRPGRHPAHPSRISKSPVPGAHPILLGQMDLGGANLDMLALQLTASPGRPPAALPVRVRPHRRRPDRRTDRGQLAGHRPARMPTLTPTTRPRRGRSCIPIFQYGSDSHGRQVRTRTAVHGRAS